MSLELVISNGNTSPQPSQMACDYAASTQIARKTLDELFNDVASGKKAVQPHSNPALLKAEAQIARVQNNDALGLYFASLFNSSKKTAREVGPEKKIERIKQKCRERANTSGSSNDNDPLTQAGCITDYERQRIWLKNMSSAQKAIELLGKVGTAVLPNGKKIYIVDVDNSFLDPNPKKPGLRELAIKYATPITLADGTETYHICETQFWLEKAAKDYKKSHEHFCESRDANDLQGSILLAITLAEPATINSLSKEWKKAGERRMFHTEERNRINLAVEQKLRIDENIKDNQNFKPAYANIGPFPTSISAPRLAQA